MPFASYEEHRAFLVRSYTSGVLGRYLSYAYLLRMLATLRTRYTEAR